MPFMVVDQHLAKHPKTRELARRIKQHPRYAAGLLGEVWGWAIDAKPDGMIGDVPSETLQGVFGVVGKTLLQELTSAGFVCTAACVDERHLDPQEHRPGRFHDWKMWAGKLVEGRERERLRGEHRRRGHPRPVDGCPMCERHPADDEARTPSNRAQNGTPSAGRAEGVGGRPLDGSNSSTGRTEPSRTQPSSTKPSPPSPSRSGQGSGTSSSSGRLPTPEEQRAANEQRAFAIVAGADGLWQRVLEAVKKEIPVANFVTWFAGTQLEQRDGVYYVSAPNAFAGEWLRTKYLPLIRATIGVLEQDVSVDVRVVDEAFLAAAHEGEDANASATESEAQP